MTIFMPVAQIPISRGALEQHDYNYLLMRYLSKKLNENNENE
jgi:hypothetical protein